MAVENGHCSSCQVQNSASICGASAQAFKTVVGTTEVGKHEQYLKLNLDKELNIVKNDTLITKELWDKVHNTLQYIKDYGELANLNPEQEKINKVNAEQEKITWIEDYNNILQALDHGAIDSQMLISKDLIDTLKIYINQYNLNDTRCDVCNASGCQTPQCCDSLCCDNECHQEQCGGGCGDSGTVEDPCYGYSVYVGQGETDYFGPDGSYYGTEGASARKYKENIQDYIQNAVELINSINIVEFNYKNDPEKNQKIGFIADDTDAQLASKNHNIMDMYNCIGVLLKAIQELSAEIKELKQEKKNK